MSTINRHNWSEKDEKILLECVNWVETNFPKGSETLAALGGKWEVVSIYLKKNGLDLTDEACKGRFFKIKRREQRKTTDTGKEVVSLLGTDFVQAKVPMPKVGSSMPVVTNLQRRVNELETKVVTLEGQVSAVMELNDNLNKFFKTFGVKVPQRNV
jgi:hypothetical protein